MTVIASGKTEYGFEKWELDSWDTEPYVNFTIDTDYESFTHDVCLDYQAAQTLHAALAAWLEENKVTP